MPRDTDHGSSTKRRSIFSRTPLTALTSINGDGPGRSNSSTNLLKKRRASSNISLLTAGLSGATLNDDESRRADSPTTQSPARPKASLTRPGSLMGSWKLHRSSESTEDRSSPVPSAIESLFPDGESEGDARSSQVLLHGEVQTSSSMFRKKREYLVLTDTYLVRFKNQQKAAECYQEVAAFYNRQSRTHNSQSSPGTSVPERHSSVSEHSGERNLGLPLSQIVAVYYLDDGRPYFALEIAFLDDDTNQASCMTLQFGDPEDMSTWLRAIRTAADKARLQNSSPVSMTNSVMAARVVEQERDYEPPNYAIYKIVLRPSGKSTSRSSTDDLSKAAASVCFLAIGAHKVHLIPLHRSNLRSMTPTIGSQNVQASHGILTLTSLHISDNDDTFELTFRMPLQKPRVYSLASLASHDIALRLRYVEENLRPEWESRPYTFVLPRDVSDDIVRHANNYEANLDSLDRTLIAYCVAYGVNPEHIRYQVTDAAEDGPCFQLLPPMDRRARQYTASELLAVLRSLRYNESFGSLSFADVHFDVLNGVHDRYGTEHVCTKTKRGTSIQMSLDELNNASLLVQEIRALAVSSKKVRRLDFTSCIVRRPQDYSESRDRGCGIVEALFPLCKYNTTNVDWVVLNNIHLGETDFDYLIQAASMKVCHFRGLGLSNTGLDDRTTNLVLDTLRHQENTLEALDISRNVVRLTPSSFDLHISAFAFIRKLNLAQLSRTSGVEPLLSIETLGIWRLSELILSGVSLNESSVDAICGYLHNFRQSGGLHELRLDNTHLTGRDIAALMQTMTEKPGSGRDMHLDISQNNLERGILELSKAITRDCAPKYLSIRLIEFEDETSFRKLVRAVAANQTILSLDLSQASLPCDASESTCQALENMFARNTTLQYLDISGEESRLETSKLGVGVNRALHGLKTNTALRTLRIEHQKLGAQGAHTLADVLKVNGTLLEVHCDHNEINMSGFTDLVNSLHRNTSLLYLPEMNEGRQISLKTTEEEIKQTRNEGMPLRGASTSTKSSTSSMRSKLTSKVNLSRSSAPGSKGSKSGRRAPTTPYLSDQDIRAALTLLDEGWARQVHRLRLYLQRNMDLANGIPTTMEIEEEEFERPPSSGTQLKSMLEKAKADRTPTVEKEAEAKFGGFDFGPGVGDVETTPRPRAGSEKSGSISTKKEKAKFDFGDEGRRSESSEDSEDEKR